MEADLIIDEGRSFIAVEAESDQTATSGFVSSGRQAVDVLDNVGRVRRCVGYGCHENQERRAVDVLSWGSLDQRCC